MDSFGRLLRLHIFGESHGPSVGVVLDGVPAGVPLHTEDFTEDMTRRKGGTPGTTPRVEADIPTLQSGVYNGKTTGTPIVLLFTNQEADPQAYTAIQDVPRPGHADFVSRIKYGGFHDPRGGGHFSGRLTVALVAAGVVAKKLIAPTQVQAEVIEIHGQSDQYAKAVSAAMAQGDSIGGIVECRAQSVPKGLGEPFFDSMESLLAHAAFSVPGVRGVEFGAGFASARMLGSQCNDEIVDTSGKTKTNNAGGINGGITNGNELVWRLAVKPPSSITLPSTSVHMQTGERTTISVPGRHDSCVALRMPVLMEAITALVLADSMMLEQRIPRIFTQG